MNFQNPPQAGDFENYRVTSANFSQSILQPLYDSILYPAAGSQLLQFFQSPQGAGVTTALGAAVGATKTIADTNMQLAGTLSSGLQFLAEGIDIAFFPGSVATASTYTPATVGFFNATASLANIAAQFNDPNIFYQAGVVTFSVLTVPYLTDTPPLKFPPRACFDLSAAIASNAAATSFIGGAVLRAGGYPNELNPPIALFPATSFNVSITYPAVVAMPSGFNGRAVVTLQGWTFRAGQ